MQSKMTENTNIEAAGMSASTQPSSPPSGVRKNRPAVWDHFDAENATEKKAKYKYYGSLIQYGNGTSSMGGHLRRCKQNLNNDSNKRRKTTTTPTIYERGILNSPSASKFDQEEARRALVKMFIGEELPFCFVESPKFRRFVHVLQARFKVPSRTTLARDIGALYAEEKMKLKDFLSANCGRV
ncbi:zinc finger BED domain-containing protein RICESLEEPER 4-like [Arachis ipaensis]|uniref:zinc finger BED domain-containing protein RICESLEEPER 4-like n=1 Tax=Arachis ipaensis TaxID=130454 RepID=UPI000A2B065C|nr:zinc finger BED domain-containing protein RICESLEEPER 4-like [Arachis ipaensis]